MKEKLAKLSVFEKIIATGPYTTGIERSIKNPRIIVISVFGGEFFAIQEMVKQQLEIDEIAKKEYKSADNKDWESSFEKSIGYIFRKNYISKPGIK